MLSVEDETYEREEYTIEDTAKRIVGTTYGVFRH